MSNNKDYYFARSCGLNDRFAKSYEVTKRDNPNAIKSVKTTKGTLIYFIDWLCTEGSVVMLNPQTIKYYQRTKDSHPDCDKYGVFFAFNNEQYTEGYNHLVDLCFISKGDKICQCQNGAFGTKESLDAFFDFYIQRDKDIPKNCDPQEVYFYEYNNYECMYAWNGDKEAYDIIVELWGEETAKTITRI